MQLTERAEDEHRLPLLLWRLNQPALAISSGALGGGIGIRHWIINATVDKSYSRLDPGRHLGELAESCGVSGVGVGLLTAVDVRERVIAADGGIEAVVTVGLGVPTWASAPDGDGFDGPGTINSVVRLPVRLTEAALVNAVITATEAKAQALFDAGVPATGTASDAICIICPPDGDAEFFAGPRSTWGARLARAVYEATRSGADKWCHTRAVG